MIAVTAFLQRLTVADVAMCMDMSCTRFMGWPYVSLTCQTLLRKKGERRVWHARLALRDEQNQKMGMGRVLRLQYCSAMA